MGRPGQVGWVGGWGAGACRGGHGEAGGLGEVMSHWAGSEAWLGCLGRQVGAKAGTRHASPVPGPCLGGACGEVSRLCLSLSARRGGVGACRLTPPQTGKIVR